MALDPKAVVSKVQRNRRVERARKDRFGAIIGTPASLPLTLPEAGVIGVSSSAAVSQGQLIVTTSTGRTLGTPALAANQVWRIGFFERGVVMNITAGPNGTARFHYLDDRRDDSVIASRTFP
jgi:hypothetical protein